MKRLKHLPPAVQQSAIYALALAGAKGISLLMVPIFTHHLSPADYGRLDVLQTLADILSIIIGLGLADTLFRFCKEDDLSKSKETAAQLYGVAWMIAGCAFILTQLAAPLITQTLPGDITLLQTRLILISLSLSGTILVPLAWLRFRGKAVLFLSGSLGRTIFQATLAAILLMAGFGVTGFVLAGFIACISLSLFLGYFQLKDTGVRFDFSAIKSFGPYGGPLIFAGFAGFILGSFDRWILAETIGTAEMAQYALAAKFGLITAVLIQPFDMWWHAKRFSVLSQSDGPERCAHVSNIAMMVVCISTLTVCTISPALITWLTPDSYHASIAFVPYLVLFAALHNLTQTLGFGIYTEKTTRLPALIDGTSAAIALIAYFTLIPTFGIMGAVIATLIALGLRFFATFLMAQRTCHIPYQLGKLVSFAGYSLITTFLISSINNLAWQVGIGLTFIGGLVLLGFLFNLISLPEKNHELTKTA